MSQCFQSTRGKNSFRLVRKTIDLCTSCLGIGYSSEKSVHTVTERELADPGLILGCKFPMILSITDVWIGGARG